MVFCSHKNCTYSSLRASITHNLTFLHIEVRMEVDFVQTSVLQAGEERRLLFSDIPEVAVVWTGATAGISTQFQMVSIYIIWLYHTPVSHCFHSNRYAR